MPREIVLKVNGQTRRVLVEPETPLIYVLRNDLGLKGTKIGCGLEQCGVCKVIIDGHAVPSCRMPVRNVQGLSITTIEGLGTAEAPHPLQQAFVEERAMQCGYCTSGMIITAKALLDRRRYPTDEEIRAEFTEDLCRCGVYDRVLRAIKRTIGRPIMSPVFEVKADDAVESMSGSPAPIQALPGPLKHTPELDSWLRFNTDGSVTIFTGKVEIGQGIRTAVAQIAAEELDLSLERVQVAAADTDLSPDEGFTSGSMSLETTGESIRLAAAEARQKMLLTAHEELEAPIERLRVTDGTITDPETGRTTTYWELFGGRDFGHKVTGASEPKRPEAYRTVGEPVQPLDLLEKVTGDACFVHDLDLPSMVHGRVIRPPEYNARLVSIDEAAAYRLPGVLKVVHDGSFLAVIAEREEQAVKAMELLRELAVWGGETTLPPQEQLSAYMLDEPDQPLLVVEGTPVHDPVPPIKIPAQATRTLEATYFRPYHMHAALGPSAAVAQMMDGKLTVWTHAQGVFPPRGAIAQVLGLPEENVRVVHAEGPGCYGHNGADDAALDAALLARALPSRPVSVKWTRGDENTWEPYGSATVLKMQASLNTEGEVIDWNHDVWAYTHTGRPRASVGTSGMLAAWHLAEPIPQPAARPNMGHHVGIHRNADPLYSFARRRIVKHFLPQSPLRVSALRSLGAYANIFAIESFMDELAHASGADPIEFRVRHLGDERAWAVLEAAAAKADWGTGKESEDEDRGLGVAFARYKNRQCYVAVIMELSVNRDSGQIRLKQATIAADAGQIVNPDGLSNQLEGGFVQAASWTLKEKVNFDAYGVISVDWTSYPIFRLSEAPTVETVLLNRPGQPYLGSGEAVMGPTGAAIANAVFDAVGVRLQELPFTPERVLEQLKS